MQTSVEAQPISGVDTPKPRTGRLRKFLKIGALTVLSLFGVYELIYIAYTASGTNEWKLVSDADGLKLWTLKTPGSPLVKVKGEIQIHARIASVVAILEETEVMDKSVGIDKTTVLEKKSFPGLYLQYVQYVHDLSKPTHLPITPREFILLMHHSQDPATRQVQINVLAAPNKLAPKVDAIRLTHLNNIWTLTPLPDGKVALAAQADVDLGGSIPYFFKNLMMTEVIKALCTSVRTLSQQDRYVNAKVDYIKELGEND